MPPLTRQRTLKSVLSWWSDSNAPGATINLHAAAKPLMKLMYQQQALDFMKRSNGVPLTPKTLEIYLSYVLYADGNSTKIAILEELETRAGFEEDARVLIHSNIVPKILQLFRLSSYDMHWELLRPSAAVLGNMASHSNSTSAAVIEPFEALLHSDSDVNDVRFGFILLSEIADSQSLAFVKRNKGVPLTPDTAEIHWSYVLWTYVSTTMKIVILKELETRAASEEDACTLIYSNIFDTILQLLRSSPYDKRWRWVWPSATILRNLASHSKSTSAAFYEPLVGLLRDSDVNDVKLVFDLLRGAANSLAGAEGVVAANVLHYLLDGLGSPNSWVRLAACQLARALARHHFTAAAVIDLDPFKQLLALCRQVTMDTLPYEALVASRALVAIANWPDGAEATVAAQILDHVPQWFTSPRPSMHRSRCWLLENLAQHKSIAGAVMDLAPCERLVTILEL
ncbi:armadillo-type protein [Mycena latifolia]|nr:armadillo-type protein [Mycena latifolia]